MTPDSAEIPRSGGWDQDEPPVAPGALPLSFSKKHGVLLGEPSAPDGAMEVLCRRNVASTTLLELRRHCGRPIRLSLQSPEEFDAAIKHAFEKDSSETVRNAGDIDQELDLNEVAKELAEPTDLLESADDAPIIRLINAVLTEAVRENASDIHIEPYEERLVVRIRVDGMLRELLTPNKVLAPLISSRVKVMSRLDIAEKRLPQDGRISLRIAGRPVDIRVSTIPTGYGERVVMRLLDKQAGRLDLRQLGMRESDEQLMEEMIRRPNGVLLVTGPTGSGKTTTLYAVLKRLNETERNIMTVEDPIEYNLEGVSQTQVNTNVDLTFARGLRAILRQDPDVVMIGEIRDLETARIAVQASLTGHLVLSTLHTNSAAGAITRLRDMGVEPFLLSSSLVGVLAQRLVRLLCPHCRLPGPPTAAELKRLGNPQGLNQIWRPVGCPKCGHTGYRGRTGVYELIPVDAELKGMIHAEASEHDMERYARRFTGSLLDDGLRQVAEGRTSLEEVARVTKEE
ncbi:MAG: type II secretion system ATPase GspE [Magnetococcales bacterium]|nr:type II secretion system ATPase GspE [Magnetococcales bacterium]